MLLDRCLIARTIMGVFLVVMMVTVTDETPALPLITKTWRQSVRPPTGLAWFRVGNCNARRIKKALILS